MNVIITGASRGIGEALSYKFASHGYDLILTCENNIDMLIQIKNDIENKYNRKVAIKKGLITADDLSDDIYILINNAGKCDYNLLQDVSYEKYKEIIYANLDYTFLTTKLVCKKMIASHQGIIINISSMWGILGAAMETIYAMTKGGINAFTKSLAKELQGSSIDVIAFALGAVNTDMNNVFDHTNMEEILKTIYNGRMYEASEIADIIYSTVINKNYQSGDIIEVNNGLK